jgi:hypothetical protein
MAGDSYAEITTANKSPDALKFRVGSCTVRVKVTSKKAGQAVFYATDFIAKYTIDGLPLCVLQIPVGTPAGPKSAEGKPDDHSFERLRAYINKYSKIEVEIEVAALESTLDVGNAMKPGKYTAFSGLVSSTRFEWAGRSSLTLQVNVVHELVALSSGTPLFSALVSADGFADMAKVITGFTDPGLGALSPEPWKMFIDTARVYLANTTAAGYLKGWIDLAGGDAKRVEEASKRSVGLLTRVQSWATLAYEGGTVDDTMEKIREHMAGIITATRQSMNLVAEMVSSAAALSCSVVFTLKDGYFIPYDPLWKREDMKFVRGGMVFHMEDIRRAGSSYVFEGYDITGTLVRYSSQVDFTTGAVLKFGSWLIPEEYIDSDYALFDEAMFPTWLNAYDIRLTSVVKEGDQTSVAPLQTSKPVSVAVPPKATEPVEPPANADFAEISRRFAYFNTMVQNLGTNSAALSLGLRDDIVPGICIGVITRAPTGEEYTVYGHVAAVTVTISVSDLSAKTQLELKAVRGDREQDLIDKEGLPNFAWLKVADKLNALTLWSPA